MLYLNVYIIYVICKCVHHILYAICKYVHHICYIKKIQYLFNTNHYTLRNVHCEKSQNPFRQKLNFLRKHLYTCTLDQSYEIVQSCVPLFKAQKFVFFWKYTNFFFKFWMLTCRWCFRHVVFEYLMKIKSAKKSWVNILIKWKFALNI
jgi:hypothetical protein